MAVAVSPLSCSSLLLGSVPFSSPPLLPRPPLPLPPLLYQPVETSLPMMHHTDLSTQTIKLFKANTHLSAKGPTEDRVTYLAGDCRRPPSGPGLC